MPTPAELTRSQEQELAKSLMSKPMFTTGHCQVTPAAPERFDSLPHSEDVLEEALRITSGDRQNQYGPPDQDFARTAAMWTALKGVPFTATDVAMFLICVKLSRQTHQKKRDNWVDIAGYARCGSKCST